jgi:ABC-type sulfate/molybdate transport systems ATPase subunit
MGILRRSVDELGQTVVIVTHDPRAAAYADRVIFLGDGRIVGELRNPTADSVLDQMKVLEGDSERSQLGQHSAQQWHGPEQAAQMQPGQL